MVPFTTGRARRRPLPVYRGSEPWLKADADTSMGNPTGYEKNLEIDIWSGIEMGVPGYQTG